MHERAEALGRPIVSFYTVSLNDCSSEFFSVKPLDFLLISVAPVDRRRFRWAPAHPEVGAGRSETY